MDVTEKWGDDVESAVKLALTDLNLTIDEVDVEVLEQPSRGFFGIGSKLARVRVSKKKETLHEQEVKEAVKENLPLEKELHDESPVDVPLAAKKTTEEVVNEFFSNEQQEEKDNSSKDSKKNYKKRESKLHNVVLKDSKTEEDYHRELEALPVCENHAAGEFLDDVIKQMGLDVNITVKADNSKVYVDIEGKDSGTIIGKRGQTLDAIQYLTSLVVNKDKEDYIKVVVDAENYRYRREQVLEKLAVKLANKVISKGRTVKLEPMNPYERKVIHATLQGDNRIVTRSEGQDPYRRVIIELKK